MSIMCCHTTVGADVFPTFIKALRAAGIRIIKEEEIMDDHARGVEEYVAVDNLDYEGVSRVAIEVYPDGERPNLESRCEVIVPETANERG